MKTSRLTRLVTAVFLMAVLVIGSAWGYGDENKQEMQRKGQRRDFKCQGLMNLSDDQKDQIETLKLNLIKEITPIKNDIGVKVALLQTSSTGDNVNVKTVNNLIEEIGALKVEMSKKRFAHKQSVRKLLTDEQKIMFDAHSGKRRMIGNRKGMNRGGKKEFMHKRRQHMRHAGNVYNK